jgi:hypothetical protein
VRPSSAAVPDRNGGKENLLYRSGQAVPAGETRPESTQSIWDLAMNREWR